MKKVELLLGLGLVLLAPSCVKHQASTRAKAANTAAKLTIEMQQSSNKLLLAAATAAAETATLSCPGSADVALNNIATGTPITLYRDISACSVTLNKFSLGSDHYTLTGSYSGSTVAGIYTNTNASKSSDQMLARSIIKVSDACVLGLSADQCDFKNVTVTFVYSEITASNVAFADKIEIDTLQFTMLQEPAPTCTVTGKFVNDANPLNPPAMELDLTGCTNTLNSSENLEFGLTTQSQDLTISTLQGVIDSNSPLKSFSPAAGTTITLSFADLQALTGKTGIVDVFTTKIILAVRNHSGISIAYYVIDNKCAENMFAVNFGAGQWVVNVPNWYTYTVSTTLTVNPLSGTYDGYCIDQIDEKIYVGNTYNGTVISSYDFTALKTLLPGLSADMLHQVNYLLNIDLTGTSYSRVDLQYAIWSIIGNTSSVTPSNSEAPNAANIAALTADAKAKGTGFIPGCHGFVAILLIPGTPDTQITTLKVPATTVIAACH